MTYIGNATNGRILEGVVVELLDCALEVRSSLVLHKTSDLSAEFLFLSSDCLPFAVAVDVTLAGDLAVDDIKPRLTSEVFQIL